MIEWMWRMKGEEKVTDDHQVSLFIIGWMMVQIRTQESQ